MDHIIHEYRKNNNWRTYSAWVEKPHSFFFLAVTNWTVSLVERS
jgi:hypothetical protein